ncbi:RNA polymerase sigma factor [Stigmatella erecta]|uniref:RNA polymerase sigma-70 factor, ECF subfamily n=1 Tax=Stigmatella erecta TaxID=83460 RepID=A0A1I0FGV4_9BACT|nr:RNA polymerase sigma factor [Stigmatella erecta]SET57247.1 RNA polymerase sigma-70 factor, ECF subfamily [Stigmatella erecta]
MTAGVAGLPAVTQIYRMHRTRALAIARRIVGDSDDAEDVVQDVFARLARQPENFQGRAAWTTWLHRVMVNSSINWLRARRRRERLSHEPQEPASPEAQAVGQEMQRHFGEALKEANELQRQVLWLREVRGFSYPEIAQVLHVPEGTVKSALHRGRVRTLEVLEARDQRP